MNRDKTAEEVKQEMIDKMGIDFGSLFYSLRNELLWLTYRWIEFRELYGTKETRIEIMNSSAPFLFYTIQNVLWENLLLGVAKVMDRPESRGKKNITFKSIPLFIKEQPFHDEIMSIFINLETESSFCRDWRNRWIAHKDHALSVDEGSAKPLEVATRLKFRTVLELMHELYNKVSLKYLGSQTAFEFLSSDRGAISLLNLLEKGLLYEQERLKKKLNGDWSQNCFQSKV
ncbi:hypothetical protein ACSX1A_03105 [Pontibacter sp. MBLB2868]|uniref:AbiU2 domain-containing protein n=1 Tax=Pontibacter sp. MBLB2868 TaxID=3451555 RepID=UPI003F75351C